MTEKIDKKNILNEIKSTYKFKKDSEFARFLGIKPQTLASWYSRNTFDIDLLYEKCPNINADWLLSGKGEKLKIIKNAKAGVKHLEELESYKRQLVICEENTKIYRDRLNKLDVKYGVLSQKLNHMRNIIENNGYVFDDDFDGY